MLRTSGKVTSNGLELFYEDWGDESHEPLVLIMGLSGQLTMWPEELVRALVEKEFRVIRFDNRDIGLSSSSPHKKRISLPATFVRNQLGLKIEAPYTLHDMAADTVGLLDALSIGKAHIVGASMGGMIAQITAGTYPERVASLTSIMSTTNHPRLPKPKLPVLLRLMGVGNKGHDRQSVLESSLKTWQLIGSPAFPPDKTELAERILRDYDRSYRPSGTLRQTLAIMATGSFEKQVKKIQAPTQIIHGAADPLVHVKGGKRSARLIPNSKLKIIPGMGHDFPKALLPEFAHLIAENARQARLQPSEA